MSDDPVDSLRRVLTYKLLGYTTLNGYETEAAQIDYLSHIVRGYGDGEYQIAEVVAAFRNHPVPKFDILLWIQSKVDEGVYRGHP